MSAQHENLPRTGLSIEKMPGHWLLAQTALSNTPASYTAVEVDDAAARQVQRYLSGENQC